MVEQWLPKSKSELISAIQHEWEALMQVVEGLPPDKMGKPDKGGWSPKDNLAHLSEWMRALMGYHMDGRPSHEVMNLPGSVTRDWDFQIINEALFKRNKDRPVMEVLDELKSVYGELVAKLNATPFERLLAPRRADDPEKRPLLNWVLGDTTEHFLEHRAQIEKNINE